VYPVAVDQDALDHQARPDPKASWVETGCPAKEVSREYAVEPELQAKKDPEVLRATVVNVDLTVSDLKDPWDLQVHQVRWVRPVSVLQEERANEVPPASKELKDIADQRDHRDPKESVKAARRCHIESRRVTKKARR